jgi:hypothetical protein
MYHHRWQAHTLTWQVHGIWRCRDCKTYVNQEGQHRKMVGAVLYIYIYTHTHTHINMTNNFMLQALQDICESRRTTQEDGGRSVIYIYIYIYIYIHTHTLTWQIILYCRHCKTYVNQEGQHRKMVGVVLCCGNRPLDLLLQEVFLWLSSKRAYRVTELWASENNGWFQK